MPKFIIFDTKLARPTEFLGVAVAIKEFPFFASSEELKKEVRIAPDNMEYTMCCWIYGDKVAFLSSAQEMMGFVVESKEMVNLLMAQWQYIWDNSTLLKN